MELSKVGRYILFACLFVTMFPVVKSLCPSKSAHGQWNEDGDRCILRCESGFEPSGCHVIRYTRGEWNHEIPHCQKEPIVSGRTLAAVGAGAAAVVAAPVVLAGAGFTAAGVAAGSLAAMLRAPFIAAWSWFAMTQIARVIGAPATTMGAVVVVIGAMTYVTSSLLSNCESE
ncbi:uncharacterized protein LOC144621436 [Crassostrea virginica]